MREGDATQLGALDANGIPSHLTLLVRRIDLQASQLRLAYPREPQMKRTELTKKTAANKGFAALGVATLTILMAWLLSPLMLIVGAPVTAWMTYRWFQYRAKWGLRF